MRHLYSILGATVLALFLGTMVSGDDKPPRTKNYLPSGWKKLNLTATQREKVTAIHADYKTRIDALTTQIETLKKKRSREMLAVLTKKQKEQLAGIGDDEKETTTPTKDKKK